MKCVSFKLLKKARIGRHSKSKWNRPQNQNRRKDVSDADLDHEYNYDVLTTGKGVNWNVKKVSTIGVIIIHFIHAGTIIVYSVNYKPNIKPGLPSHVR